MLSDGVQPNVVTYCAVIDACAKAGNLQRAEQMHERMVDAGVARVRLGGSAPGVQYPSSRVWPARTPERGEFGTLAGHGPQGSELDETWCPRLALCRGSRVGASQGPSWLRQAASGPPESAKARQSSPRGSAALVESQALRAIMSGQSSEPSPITVGRSNTSRWR